MGKVIAFFDRWLGRLSGVYSFWPLLPAGAIGVITGYFSSGVALINRAGPFGWLLSGLIAFALSCLALLALASAQERWATVKAFNSRVKDLDYLNPLDSTFHKKRLRLSDIVHPLTRRTRNKTFTECEIVGPDTIALVGAGSFSESTFLNVDFVIVREGAPVINVILLENCNFIRCTVTGCTFYVPQELYDRVTKDMPSVKAITYGKTQ